MFRYGDRLQNKRSRFTDIVFILCILAFLGVSIFALYSGAGIFRTILQKKNQDYSISELWSKQEYGTILELTERTLEESPLDPVALMFRGYSYFLLALSRVSVENRNADLDKSIYYLRQLKALPDFGEKSEIDYILGKTYLFKGHYWADMAIRYLNNAYNAGNNAPDLLEFIAKAYYELGELDMAYQWYKIAEEKYPTDRLFMALGNVAFKLGDYEESAQYYIRSVETTKDDLLKKTGLFQLAQLYYDIGNYLKGLEVLEYLVSMQEKNYEFWFLLAETYYELGKTTEARRAWHTVTRINPEHVGALRRLYN